MANAPKPIDKKIWFALILILIYAYSYCVYSLKSGKLPEQYFTQGDDATYPYFAQQFLSGHFTETQFVYSLRIMQILPIAFLTALFGESIYVAPMWNVLSFLGCIVTIFFICRKLYNGYAGLLASFLFAFFPLVAILGYTMNPHLPQAFVTSLILLILIYSKEKKFNRLGYVCGSLLVIAPLVTSTGAILIIITAAYLIFNRIFSRQKIPLLFQKHLLYMFIFFSLLTATFNYVYSGNPLITITATASAFSLNNCLSKYSISPINLSLYNKFNILTDCNAIFDSGTSNISYYLVHMFPYNLASLQTIFYQYGTAFLGPFFYILVISLLYLVIKKQKGLDVLMFYLLVTIAYLMVGPSNIDLSPFRYVTTVGQWKFLTLVAVPVVGIISIAFLKYIDDGKTFDKRTRLLIVSLVIAFMVVTSVLADQYVALV